jgi:O-antigen ligase
MTQWPSSKPVRPHSNTWKFRGLCAGLARLALFGVVAAAPWAFGGVGYQTQQFLYLGVLAALCCSLPLLLSVRTPPFRTNFGTSLRATIGSGRQSGGGASLFESLTGNEAATGLPVVLLPGLGILCLAVAQLLPLETLSLNRAQRIGRSHVDRPAATSVANVSTSAADSAAPWRTISFYPASTRLEVARIATALSVFILGALLFRTRQTQIWLWGLLSANGAALAFFGIAQKLSWNEKIYWTVPLKYGGLPFAAFVNRNNAAGYLNICLAAAIGLLVWAIYRGSTATSQRSIAPQRNSALKRRLLSAVAQIDTLHVAAWLLPVLIIAGVVSANSRGGILSMLLAGSAVLLAFARIRQTRGLPVLLALALVLGLTLVGWVGLSGDVRSRLASLADPQITADSRLSHWRDSLQAVRDFPLVGTGWGTYRYAYQPYQSRPADWFYNADNQYLEILVESGTIGLCLVLAGMVLFGTAVRFVIRASRSVPDDASGFVGLFVLISQGLQAFFDFGILIPANLLCCALVCGAVAGRAAYLATLQPPPGGLSEFGAQGSGGSSTTGAMAGSVGGHADRRVARLVALPDLRPLPIAALAIVLLMFNGGLAVREVATAAAARAALRELPSLASAEAVESARLDRLIEQTTRIADRRPDDAELRMALAELWIHRYRLQTFELLRQQPDVAKRHAQQDLWNFTDLAVLHHRVNTLQQAGGEGIVHELQSEERIAQNLLPALQHLTAAQSACAILPDRDLMLAQLAFLIDPAFATGETHLQRAIRLFPGDPELLYRAGLFAHNVNRNDLAHAAWRRSLQLSPTYERQIGNLLGEPQSPASAGRESPD